MDNQIIFPLLAMFIAYAFFVYKFYYFKAMHKEVQSNATVIEIKPLSVFSAHHKITVEYSDSQGKKYTKTTKPFGQRSYKIGEILDIAYKRANPKEVVIWNGQEAFFKQQFFWLAVLGVLVIAAVIAAPHKNNKAQDSVHQSRVLD